jgi:hypothetical protein
MAKSNSINISTVEQAVNNAVDYLKKWSHEELARLMEQTSKGHQTPLIIKVPNKGYVIGNYFLEQIDNRWWRLTYRYGDREYIFFNKLSAVCYAVYSQTNNCTRAERILQDDEQVGRLTLKTEQYYFRYQQAIKKKNTHKTDLFLVRYQESLQKLSNSKNLLEKSLKSAKYIKF